MRVVPVLLTLVLTASLALAQESVPPPPQPAPDKPPAASSGPSLEVTLKFIQDKVNQQGSISYSESIINASTGENLGTSTQMSQEIQVVAVDPAGGLSLQEKVSVALSGLGSITSNGISTWQVNFKDLDRLEVMSSGDYKHSVAQGYVYQDSPQFFELIVHLASGKIVRQHSRITVCSRGIIIPKQSCKPQESDANGGVFLLHFRNEETADRVAKAMIHAIDLCGGGSPPEPF